MSTLVPTASSCTPACLNGGTCLTDANGESRCNCPNNYIGSDCSQAVNCIGDGECAGNNTCKVYQGQNYCDCVDGTTGFFCDVPGSPGESSL